MNPLHDDATAPARAQTLAVQAFIDAHRAQGYRHAALDPLGEARPLGPQRLSPAQFGLTAGDAVHPEGGHWRGARQVQALDALLKAAYCGSLVLDASAVRDEARCHWLHEQMESRFTLPLPAGTALLDRLVDAQAWEHYVAERYPDGKRFSLEGCEALLPLMDALVHGAAANGVGEVFIGMPHRGRVNLLVNLMGVPAAQLLDQFEPVPADPASHTDLVYHHGAARRLATPVGEVMLRLAHNPSHLQSVYPVVMGMTHAAMARGRSAMAIVMHGDAAFAGQGVVMETLALTQKPGYAVGGTVHVVINNQVGFTERNPMDPQRARYCTDVTRGVDAPVLRVNADAPEEVLRAAAIAVAYRQRFASDVVIDLIGYRRLGHSEHDAPKVTHPLGYALTARKPSVVEVYGAALAATQGHDDADITARITARRTAARAGYAQPAGTAAPGCGLPVQSLPAATRAPQHFGRTEMQAAIAAMTHWPVGFVPHPVIERLVQYWQGCAEGRHGLVDWCLAENLAYASLLQAGVDVRVSGLDVQRGTFMHRHAVWHDQEPQPEQPAQFVPLWQLGGAARFDVVNSVLSEEAVLGFEYGYSVQAPRALTVWEAQFGDFVNGAQVYIDQYIAAGEEKWGYRCPLTLLLPHGYEGVGPEHSNAHLARFLQLCGANNLRVAYPSTAGQFYKLLRAQALAATPKPLVVMTPKAVMLADADSHTPVAEMLEGDFQPVLGDAHGADAQAVRRVVLCSGKLHHGLHRARVAQHRPDVALLRLEALYPFPAEALRAALAAYPHARSVVWAQEETPNQGAWHFVRDDIAAQLPPGATLQCVARPATAAGASSSYLLHAQQERELVARALGAS